MSKNVLTAIVIAGSLASSALAAERATFILTNGERVSGAVVFHTDERTNIRADKQEFNVGVVDGREVPIPVGQVAVIDFVGGTPPNQELAALDDVKQTLVRRDGSTRQGRLIDLVGGDTVRWEDAGGRREDMPIRDVSRVYLNTVSSRTLFNYSASATTTPSSRDITPASASVGQAAANVEVRAATAWNDTGLTIRRGERLSFAATGKTAYGAGAADTAGPEGNDTLRRATYPVPNMPVGALIGRIGNGPAFFIGSNSQPISMESNGRLMLAVNDDHYPDNDGALRVAITRGR